MKILGSDILTSWLVTLHSARLSIKLSKNDNISKFILCTIKFIKTIRDKYPNINNFQAIY